MAHKNDDASWMMLSTLSMLVGIVLLGAVDICCMNFEGWIFVIGGAVFVYCPMVYWYARVTSR